MVAIRLLKEAHPSHMGFDPHTETLLAIEIPEESGRHTLPDGRTLTVDFDFKAHPARATFDCRNFPEFQGKRGGRKERRIVQFGQNGVGRNRIMKDTVLEVDLERKIISSDEAIRQAAKISAAGREAKRATFLQRPYRW